MGFSKLGGHLALSFFSLHFAASCLFLPIWKTKDLFPLFTWSMFSSCKPKKTGFEMEMALRGGKTLNSKSFSGHRTSLLMSLLRKAQDERRGASAREADLQRLLRRISLFAEESSFEYKIYKSKYNTVEYAKSPQLKKGALISEGRFKALPSAPQ